VDTVIDPPVIPICYNQFITCHDQDRTFPEGRNMKIKSRPILLVILGIVLAFLIATAVTFCGLHEMQSNGSSGTSHTVTTESDEIDRSH